ncbi:hypothetical protein [Halobacterium hubeiense]|uniref:DUF7835 family putative zinc beta-ribbon protein n=1 Tax=Halobacterium hubeiense TaxID=1407499 RepID=UPI003C746F1A
MGSDAPGGDSRRETCENCCRETPHDVTVDLLVERAADSSLARRPYRVSTCREFGAESRQAIGQT